MNEIEQRIFVSPTICDNEYDWTFGGKKDVKVTFTYLNVVNGKETDTTAFNYHDALELARSRARDKRYKNYQFVITD